MDPPPHINQQLPPAHQIQQLPPPHQVPQADQNQPPEQQQPPMNHGVWTPSEIHLLSALKRDFAYLFSDVRYRGSAWQDISNSLRLVGRAFRSAEACEQQYNFLVRSRIHIDPVFLAYNDRDRNELTDPPERAVTGQWTERELNILDELRRNLWGNSISIARGDGEIWFEVAARMKRMGFARSPRQCQMKSIPPRNTNLTREEYDQMFNIPPAPAPGAPAPPSVRVVQNDDQGNPSSINLNFEVAFPSRMRNCTVHVNLPPAQEDESYRLTFTFTTGNNNGN